MQKMCDSDTLIEQSKYSNRRVTKKTAQLQSNPEVQPESSQPVDNTARVKSHLHTVQLEPVTVQQHSR